MLYDRLAETQEKPTTFWEWTLVDLLRRWDSRRFVVSPATYDGIWNLHAEESAHLSRQLAVEEREGSRVNVKHREAAMRYVATLAELAAFVRERCSVGAVPELARLEASKREQATELVGRDGVESITLAMREGCILWTDDGMIPVLAREQFAPLRRVWTQLALEIAVEENVMTREGYLECSAKLLGWSYVATMWNIDILVQAGVLAQWQCDRWPLRQALAQFGDSGIPIPGRIGAAAKTIVAMFRKVASPFTRDAVIRAILNRLANRHAARALAEVVDMAFGLDAISATEAQAAIAHWLRGPLWLP